jgi:putative CocE/NonD family hydrolase
VSFTVKSNIRVAMRDGVELATWVWLPESDKPLPTLLARTPYGAEMMHIYAPPSPNIFRLMCEGYAVAVQECRGTYKSDGVFVPHVHDVDDGKDALDWLAAQPWCDGNIGTFGSSYLGMVQWDMASTGHPALKAIAPSVAPADRYRGLWYSAGGALSTGALGWGALMTLSKVARDLEQGAGDPADLGVLAAMVADIKQVTTHAPIADQPVLHKHMPWLIDTALGHPERDDTWASPISVTDFAQIRTPAFIIGGWYDLFIAETLRTYTEMRRQGGAEDVRDGQYLMIGPWGHSINGQLGMYPDRIFGPAASVEASQAHKAQIAFFDHFLKGKAAALERPRVRLFVMGIDQWRDEADWPLPDTNFTGYYLSGDGPANSAMGNGTLAAHAASEARKDSYLFDPRRPVPTHGGTGLALLEWDGAADQRPVHDRNDVLVFSSGILTEPLEVTGPVKAHLFVSSSEVDTDFTAKLIDVHPDGRAIILCDGIQRMRYRNSLEVPEMMEPGEIYEIMIDLIATSNVFLPGHRLMVEISSSNFPRYDRNSNTGGRIAFEAEDDMIAAVNAVHRGGLYPSRIVLPVIPPR